MMYNKSGAVDETSAVTENEYLLGRSMYKRLLKEKRSHRLGEKIKYGSLEGNIIGLYPNFILVRSKNYNFTISYIDLIMNTVRSIDE